MPLIFIHGREIFRKNTFLVCFLFYKNVLLVFPIFIFGFLDFFEGDMLYGVYIYAIFNVVFTSTPIIWLSLYGNEYKKEEYLKNPDLYYQQIDRALWRLPLIFWKWIIYGLFQSCFMFFICRELFMLSDSTDHDSKHYYFWGLGLILTAQLIFIINFKAISCYQVIDGIGVLLFCLSNISFYLVMYGFTFFDKDDSNEMIRIVTKVKDLPIFWVMYFTLFIAFYLIDHVLGMIYLFIFP
jgi:phospholipid-translocating ATPase